MPRLSRFSPLSSPGTSSETSHPPPTTLVHQQDLRLQVGGHGEGKADVHAGRVTLHRGVDELLDLGKGDGLVEPTGFLELVVDIGFLHPQDRAVEVDVLPPGQLGRMKDENWTTFRIFDF